MEKSEKVDFNRYISHIDINRSVNSIEYFRFSDLNNDGRFTEFLDDINTDNDPIELILINNKAYKEAAIMSLQIDNRDKNALFGMIKDEQKTFGGTKLFYLNETFDKVLVVAFSRIEDGKLNNVIRRLNKINDNINRINSKIKREKKEIRLTRIKSIIKKPFNLMGYDITRLETPDYTLMKLLNKHNINLILDVGANTGQFAERILSAGFKGELISFEPQNQPYSVLVRKENRNWKSENFALGNSNGRAEINISQDDTCSSIHKNNTVLCDAVPTAKYVGKEEIEIKKLDDVYDNYVDKKKHSVYLKIDVEGYEKRVLEGAKNVLPSIRGIQLELHATSLYGEGETLLEEQIIYLKKLGFNLASLHPQYITADGAVITYDGAFFRK